MYQAEKNRYETMNYNRCGKSGLKLPEVSLGLWHNFGDTGNFETMKQMCFTAFDNGITHFDLANNYGPEPGSAEKNFGRILKKEMKAHRDEMIISTKAGYLMWDGPYGDFGSRKYMLASLDPSLGVSNVYLFSRDEVHAVVNAYDAARRQLQMNSFTFNLNDLYANTPKINTSENIRYADMAENPQ